MLVTYEPQMAMIAEWWKQLFGESEGKEGKGILPCSATFSTDLHSLGQFIQEGKKMLYETLLLVETPTLDGTFPSDGENLDNMNYLAGKSLDLSLIHIFFIKNCFMLVNRAAKLLHQRSSFIIEANAALMIVADAVDLFQFAFETFSAFIHSVHQCI